MQIDGERIAYSVGCVDVMNEDMDDLFREGFGHLSVNLCIQQRECI